MKFERLYSKRLYNRLTKRQKSFIEFLNLRFCRSQIGLDGFKVTKKKFKVTMHETLHEYIRRNEIRRDLGVDLEKL